MNSRGQTRDELAVALALQLAPCMRGPRYPPVVEFCGPVACQAVVRWRFSGCCLLTSSSRSSARVATTLARPRCLLLLVAARGRRASPASASPRSTQTPRPPPPSPGWWRGSWPRPPPSERRGRGQGPRTAARSKERTRSLRSAGAGAGARTGAWGLGREQGGLRLPGRRRQRNRWLRPADRRRWVGGAGAGLASTVQPGRRRRRPAGAGRRRRCSLLEAAFGCLHALCGPRAPGPFAFLYNHVVGPQTKLCPGRCPLPAAHHSPLSRS